PTELRAHNAETSVYHPHYAPSRSYASIRHDKWQPPCSDMRGTAMQARISRNLKQKIRQSSTWSRLIPEEEWQIYLEVMREAHRRGIDFALGGAFAVAAYTGFWRNTKDLDLYVVPRDRDALAEVLTSLGFIDYYDQCPYDRRW